MFQPTQPATLFPALSPKNQFGMSKKLRVEMGCCLYLASSQSLWANKASISPIHSFSYTEVRISKMSVPVALLYLRT